MHIQGQELPLGYAVHFKSGLESQKSIQGLCFSSFSMSKFNKAGGLSYMTLDTKAYDSSEVFLPPAAALIDRNKLGDFICKAKLRVKSPLADSCSGVYFIVGLRDSLNYYALQVQESNSKFYRIYKGERTLVDETEAFFLEADAWVELIMRRDILKRCIVLSLGDRSWEVSDSNLVMGYLGFGTFTSSLDLDELILWAPTSIDQKSSVF